jgi:hypothetical protein
MRVVGKLDARSDFGGVQRRRARSACSASAASNSGTGQRSDQIVEVTRVALSDGLEIPDAIEHDAPCSGRQPRTRLLREWAADQ